MKDKNYQKSFDKLLKNITELFNSNNGKDISYGDITDQKYCSIYQFHEIDKNGWEHNYSLTAALIPEWSKSISRIRWSYAGITTSGNEVTEQEDFNEYYKNHPDKEKPLYMWRSPLKINFEYNSYDYGLITKVNHNTIKNSYTIYLDYNAALDNYNSYKNKTVHMLERVAEEQIIIEYYLVKELIHPKSEDCHYYQVSPKLHKALLSKKYLKDLENNNAIILEGDSFTKQPDQLIAISDFYTATMETMLHTFQIDYKIKNFTQLNSEQLNVFQSFLKSKKN